MKNFGGPKVDRWPVFGKHCVTLCNAVYLIKRNAQKNILKLNSGYNSEQNSWLMTSGFGDSLRLERQIIHSDHFCDSE